VKPATRLTALAFCLAIITTITAGCWRKAEPKPEPTPVPVVGLVEQADALETKLEARLRWDAARMLEDGELPDLRAARDWLKERWPNAQFEASLKLREAEQATIKEPADAIRLWRQWAIEADPTLKAAQ